MRVSRASHAATWHAHRADWPSPAARPRAPDRQHRAVDLCVCVGPFVFGQVRTISRRAHRRSARVRAMVGARRRADRPDVVLPVGVHFSGLRKLSHPRGPPDTTGRLGTPRRQLTGFQNAKPILYGYTVIRPIYPMRLRGALSTAVESGKRKGDAARAAACAAAGSAAWPRAARAHARQHVRRRRPLLRLLRRALGLQPFDLGHRAFDVFRRALIECRTAILRQRFASRAPPHHRARADATGENACSDALPSLSCRYIASTSASSASRPRLRRRFACRGPFAGQHVADIDTDLANGQQIGRVGERSSDSYADCERLATPPTVANSSWLSRSASARPASDSRFVS